MTAEFVDLEKPISELTAGEAYSRFIACKSPDDPDYGFLYNRMETLLCGPATGYAWTVVGGRKGNEHQEQLIEDAVQNSFLKIIRQQGKDKNQRTGEEIGGRWTRKVNGATFESWFNGIVGNQVRDLRRKAKGPIGPSLRKIKGDASTTPVTPKIDDNANTPVEVVTDYREKTASESAEDEEKKARLKSCLDKLEDPFRDVLNMIFYEHKSQTEIAEQLETNNTAVTRWKINAMEQIKECVGTL